MILRHYKGAWREPSAIYRIWEAQRRTVLAVYRCVGGRLRLVWQAVRSCFGTGRWVNGRPWINADKWKNTP